ncbi:MAG: glycosyltransferase family 4 protein [Anaerolineae bacterium]|nr:glycosyltransferase family 4 protein [Anaerolineae bacterium]
MNIGIDYTSAANQGAGIGRLTRSIVRALAEIDAAQSTGHRFTLFVQGRDMPHASGRAGQRNRASGIDNANWREVCTRIDERWWHRIWHRLHVPLAVEWLVGPVDLFHSPDFTLPPTRRGTRTLVTVHDLSFMRLPGCFEPALLDYLNANVPAAIRRADQVLADSEHTRRDVIELFGVPEAQVQTILCGVENRFKPIQDAEQLESIRCKYRLPPRFVLSLGTLQPRKNYGTLIQALARLRATDVSLVIVGGKGWLYENIFEQVETLNLANRVLFPGFIDDADLPALYNLAEVFALASLYEGFGLPPLEAMACGVPVVASNNSSLPQVVGEAGLLLDAENVDAWVDALDRLLDDAMFRHTLGEHGRQRASQFTWHKAARALLTAYESLG